MQIETYIDSLVSYAMNCGLAEPCDHMVLTNKLLELLGTEESFQRCCTVDHSLENLLYALYELVEARLE